MPSQRRLRQFAFALTLGSAPVAVAAVKLIQFRPDLGVNASLRGRRPFPADNPWNQRVDREPIDPHSAQLIASIGMHARLHPDFGPDANNGIPYIVVAGTARRLQVVFDNERESDPGPYPMPPNAPIEGGVTSKGDRHIIVIDRDNWKLYEMWRAVHRGEWIKAGSGAVFDLDSNDERPAGWTSADAAGLPIFPGLVRYDEVVERGAIKHALRFTAARTRKAYTSPARHSAGASADDSLPPMGMRVRLKRSYDISGFPETAQVVLRALKTYGMILADNGGNWYISGAPDPRWDVGALGSLAGVFGKDLEVVRMGGIVSK